jgi:hypothetical protein
LSKTNLLFGNDFKLVPQSLTMALQEITDDFDFVQRALIFQPKKNHSFVRTALPVYQLPEILIVGNQDPTLIESFSDDFFICGAARLVIYRKDLMPAGSQPLRNRRAGALVNQKAHLYRGFCQRHECRVLHGTCRKQQARLYVFDRHPPYSLMMSAAVAP